MDGAGAALRDPASVFGAGEAKILANHPQQRRVRITVELATRAIYVERDRHLKAPRSSKGCRTPASVVRMGGKRRRTESTRRSTRPAVPACRARARGFR